MSLILNIDTATELASVSLAADGKIISSITNAVQKDHAAFLHPAIGKLLKVNGKDINALDAIAVTEGPGSYTGIRVGMASAKGLCAALGKPFLTINSLELLAKDAILNYSGASMPVLFCPMIDARRMEVFTALYDHSSKEILKPCAMVLNEASFGELPANSTIIYFGSGSEKWKNVVKLRNSLFMKNVNIPHAMAVLTFEKFIAKSFTDLVYSEPLYVKEFYNG
jgi:tRNA threonylcarbamoyladenosine biosynthesis protein TsaB